MNSQIKRINIALLDARMLVRMGFALFVEDHANVHLAGAVRDVNELLALCQHHDIDVAIIGYLHHSVVSDAVEHVLTMAVPPQIVTVGPDTTATHATVDAAVDADELMTLVRSAVDGRRSPRVAPVSPVISEAQLTPQQRVVLTEISDGRSTAAISQRLRLSPKTVEHHKQQMYVRLGVHSRAEAVAVGFQLGLLPAPSTAADR